MAVLVEARVGASSIICWHQTGRCTLDGKLALALTGLLNAGSVPLTRQLQELSACPAGPVACTVDGATPRVHRGQAVLTSAPDPVGSMPAVSAIRAGWPNRLCMTAAMITWMPLVRGCPLDRHDVGSRCSGRRVTSRRCKKACCDSTDVEVAAALVPGELERVQHGGGHGLFAEHAGGVAKILGDEPDGNSGHYSLTFSHAFKRAPATATTVLVAR